jgi:hypothetical protein
LFPFSKEGSGEIFAFSNPPSPPFGKGGKIKPAFSKGDDRTKGIIRKPSARRAVVTTLGVIEPNNA